jgi:hypothetical protein
LTQVALFQKKVNKTISKYLEKLYFQKWIIGICRDNIKDIIRNKTFNPDIKWLLRNSYYKIHADPFILNTRNGQTEILLEELKFEGDYGRIILMTLDNDFNQIEHRTLLDTKSHLSYPFIFQEQNRTFVFPEASKSGRLSCYEYIPVSESLNFYQDILELPLLDSTILKYNNKYWIFGTLSENITDYRLFVFSSDRLFGPYVQHRGNPVKIGLDGTRPAGNFIEVDGIIYRPVQNCQNEYGESITINKITELTENSFVEELHMTIVIDKNNRLNKGIRKIHTINVKDNLIILDGKLKTFDPIMQIKHNIGKK